MARQLIVSIYNNLGFEFLILYNLQNWKNDNVKSLSCLNDVINNSMFIFFRTIYENGNFADYEHDIKELINGGWEIGLHLDPSSVNDFDKIKDEKEKLEKLSKIEIKSNRVHYLGFNEYLPNKLQQLGFVYDSSVRRSKDRIDENELGYFRYGQLIEFPITIMDAYLFTYMKISEEKIIDTFKDTLNLSRKINPDFNVITVNWHDNVLQMKGGRMYKKILEYLTSQDDVKICKGIELAKIIESSR